MKVAFVTSHPIQYQVPIFRELNRREDVELTVLFAMLPDATTQGDGFGVQFEWDIPTLDGYNYHVLENVSGDPSVTKFSGCNTPGVRKVLRDLAVDAVVVNGWVVKTCLQTLWGCKQLKIPCIVRGEANNLRLRPRWKRFVQRLLVQQYDAFLPIGTANTQFYKSYGISEALMFDAPYCIENQRFANAASVRQSRKNELRERWNIPENALCYLYCGKFEPKKHPTELVKAFIEAQNNRKTSSSAASPLHLLMVGDGALRKACEELAALQTQPSSITFTGFLNQSEIVDAYVASDCLVLPSDAGETWGLVVNEAFACKRPAIVSSQVGCAADLIIEGQTGYQFDFGNWTQLAMLLATGSKDLFGKMGDSASELIKKYRHEIAAEGIVRAASYCISKKNTL